MSSLVPVGFNNENFSWETYIYGIDATVQDSSLRFISADTDLTGYSIDFDFVHNFIKFQVGLGSNIGTVSASIQNLRNECGYPPNYHYFAGSYLQGCGMFLYIDGQQVAFQSYTGGVGPASTNFEVANGIGLFVDEFVIYGGVIDPNTVANKYLMTKERQKYLGMPKGSYYPYHQARFTVFASGSNEFELHAFSIRGLQNVSASILDPRLAELYVTPFFSSASGSAAQAIGGIFY